MITRRRLAFGLAVAAVTTLMAACLWLYAAMTPSCTWFGHAYVASPPGRKRVALTFDDGPHPQVTPRILDILAQHGARATFFVLGERALQQPEIVQRIVREGHAIGNHSYDHRALAFISRDAIASDLAMAQQNIGVVSGRPATWFRPPYGLRDHRVLAAAESLGMQTALWSHSPRDWQDPSPVELRERMASAPDGAIVLLHDGDAGGAAGRPNTAEALPGILADLAARGLRPVTLDELLGSERDEAPR
jgi:peptidoglycan/xylan/chitin deacetylase (PgdA/CDA1 family)